ncbi:MAG: hypothetical protein OEZ06_29590 [Myxococcales bacterium]|nr:hypothetical protein [Myxococcales bacterium]
MQNAANPDDKDATVDSAVAQDAGGNDGGDVGSRDAVSDGGEAATAASGEIAAADVAGIALECVTAYSFGVIVSGPDGEPMLQNAAEVLAIGIDGEHFFATKLLAGEQYAIEISAQPDGQRCWVVEGAGTVAAADVTGIGVEEVSCASVDDSSHTLTIGSSMVSGLVCEVITEDATNSSDSGGSANLAAITDFTHFDNRYRGWGAEGGSFASGNNRNSCIGSATCRIWDYALQRGDAVACAAHGLPKGSSSMVVAFGRCDTDPLAQYEVSICTGSGGTWMPAAIEETILQHAVEVMGDAVGDDDLLCESEEACLYSPNVGAYPGHGAVLDATTLGSGGSVENVDLDRHSFNGYGQLVARCRAHSRLQGPLGRRGRRPLAPASSPPTWTCAQPRRSLPVAAAHPWPDPALLSAKYPG